MAIFAVWAGGLGVGFGVVALIAGDRIGPVRTILYAAICMLLVLTAARTLYELIRQLRARP